MAQQESLIKLKGKIGDLTFYKTRNGYQAREAKGIDGARIANDPAFQRTRENGIEFGRAGQAAKVLRDALRPVTLQYSDPRMHTRLNSRMLRVVKADAVNDRGERRVLPERTVLLKGFNFNSAAQIGNVLFTGYTSTVNRTTGEVNVFVEALDPKVAIAAPAGATHFQVRAAGLAVDFDSGAAQLVTEETTLLGLDEPVPALQMAPELSPVGTNAVFVVFGLGFFQEINGKQYPLNNGAFNVLTIIDVSGS